jgi:hypothetical protein
MAMEGVTAAGEKLDKDFDTVSDVASWVADPDAYVADEPGDWGYEHVMDSNNAMSIGGVNLPSAPDPTKPGTMLAVSSGMSNVQTLDGMITDQAMKLSALLKQVGQKVG